MESSIIITIIRSIAVYAFALILARAMGRKLISQMTFFDFVVGVTMGTLIASLMDGSSKSFVSSIIALTIISFLSIGLAFININTLKFFKFFI